MKKTSFLIFASLLAALPLPRADALDWAGNERNNAENGFLAPSQDLVVMADSSPVQSAAGARIHFTTNGGDTCITRDLSFHGTAYWDQHDRWTVNLGRFPEGTVIDYSLEVSGTPSFRLPPDSNQIHSVRVRNRSAAIRWMGDFRTEPACDRIFPGNPIRFHCRTRPLGVAAGAELGVSTNDGTTWVTVPMKQGPATDGADTWSTTLDGFPAGTEIRTYVRAWNGDGDSAWDSNSGSDYRLRIQSAIHDVWMDKGRYNPGETAGISVELQQTGDETNGMLRVKISHLGTVISRLQCKVSLPSTGTRTLMFPWKCPPQDFQGYGVDVAWISGGKVRDFRSTALDVSSDWTRFPRFGFFSEYPEHDDAEAQAAELAKFHLNAIQFYDWKWTHDRLVPYDADGSPANVFTQVGGRVQSFRTVRDKIAALHDRNMAAMSYTLMYGDSGNDQPEHIEWAAFKKPNATDPADIRKHDAGNYKIWVMDVSNPDWKAHLFNEFDDAIEKAGFDGIHLDNLGEARNYRYNSGEEIREREAFPQFINEARAHIRSTHPDARLTHNDVMGNYLPEIAASDSDIYYSEVWSRHSYQDIRDNIREAQTAGNGKPVVLAAYINRKPWDEIGDPVSPSLPTFINDASARLMAATVFANGGFRIELGNGGDMLVNEYFPHRHPRMHEGLRRAMRDLYDFAVRYENLLFFDSQHPLRDTTGDLPITSPSHRLSPRAESDAIWTLSKTREDGAIAVNLINLNGVDDQWRNVSANPEPQTNIRLKVKVDTPIRQVLCTTPDDGSDRLDELPFKMDQHDGGTFITFTVPTLKFWDLILLFPETKN